MAKKKTHYLFKGEAFSVRTSKEIADMVDDAFWDKYREGAAMSVVPAGEYEILLMHCEEFAKQKAAVRREFRGEEDRMVAEICKLREANERHRADIERLKKGS